MTTTITQVAGTMTMIAVRATIISAMLLATMNAGLCANERIRSRSATTRRRDVARELAVVVVDAELRQPVEDAAPEHERHALTEPLGEDPQLPRQEPVQHPDDRQRAGEDERGPQVRVARVAEQVVDPTEHEVGADLGQRHEEHQSERDEE